MFCADFALQTVIKEVFNSWFFLAFPFYGLWTVDLGNVLIVGSFILSSFRRSSRVDIARSPVTVIPAPAPLPAAPDKDLAETYSILRNCYRDPLYH